MRRIFALCVFTLSVPGVCFAQNNLTDSITITTYYPAPYGVYKNLRLNPTQEPTDPAIKQAGTLYFNQSDQKPYVYNGTSNKWERIADDEVVAPPTTVSPNVCGGSLNTGVHAGQLCSVPWYQDITFTRPFSTVPHVMVFLQKAPDAANSSCAGNATDQWIAYPVPGSITTTGFRLVASGSPDYDDPGNCGTAYKAYYTRAEVSWFAISE